MQSLYGNIVAPERGELKMTMEEGLMRKFTRRTACDTGKGHWNKCLPKHTAAGMF